ELDMRRDDAQGDLSGGLRGQVGPAGADEAGRGGAVKPGVRRGGKARGAPWRLATRPTYIAWDPASTCNALPSYFPIVATTAYVSGVTISGIRARSWTIRSASCEGLSPSSVVTRTVR